LQRVRVRDRRQSPKIMAVPDRPHEG
jgi:hypothetical protein